jgi:uncharacterized RDD family membrane protein YckC
VDEHLRITSAEGLELALPIAGLGARSYAFIIDWHVRALLALAWVLLVFVVLSQGAIFWQGNWAQFFDSLKDESRLLWWVLVLPPSLIYFLYHPVLEVLMHGRTPGKRMAGVRIVSVDGHEAGLGALLIRNVFRLLDSLPGFYGLGMLVVMFSARQVRIGDLAAGTLLVYEQAAAPDTLASAGSFGGLSLQQAETIRELLDRWRDLDRPVRIGLALKLMESLGERPALSARERANDRLLQARLTELVGKP